MNIDDAQKAMDEADNLVSRAEEAHIEAVALYEQAWAEEWKQYESSHLGVRPERMSIHMRLVKADPEHPVGQAAEAVRRARKVEIQATERQNIAKRVWWRASR